MTNTDSKSRFYILHLEVIHGSDRYDIHIHMERPPLVRDLMGEVETKARVTLSNQQLLFRGQRLHITPDKPLEEFGLFNGNRITLVGDKLSGIEDEHFLRLLSIEKNIKIIDDVLERVCRDFEKLKEGKPPRNQCESNLSDIQGRGEHCRIDLKNFQSTVTKLNVDPSEVDACRKQIAINKLIQDRLDISSNVISAISSYQGDHDGK